MRKSRLCRGLLTLAISVAGVVWTTVSLQADPSPPGSAVTRAAADTESAAFQNASDDLTLWINGQFQLLWKQHQVTPEFCDDLTYLRRVSLDIIGRIPSVAEIREFEADRSPEKRARLVEKLLSDPQDSTRMSPLAAEHLARIWRQVLLPPGASGAALGPELESWLRDQFASNIPYPQIIHQLLTARGEEAQKELQFYLAAGQTPEAQATEFSRAFLGIRIGCAQCHNHPFADWKQQDFWGMAAFFSGLKLGRVRVVNNAVVQDDILNDDDAKGVISYEGVDYSAKVLWEDRPVAIAADTRPRELLADWMTSAKHPTFSANAVNRVWQALLGRGLVAAADDLDLEPAASRVLVDEFGRQFVAVHSDLRILVSSICRSEPYQCVTFTTAGAAADPQNGSRPLKAMSPEQMFASLEQALSLPVSRTSGDAARHNGEMTQLVQRLGETAGRSPEEYIAGVPQTLMLMNGPLLARATDLEQSHTLRGVVEAPFLSDAERIEILYLATLSRRPVKGEQERCLKEIQNCSSETDRQSVFGNLLWALVNSPEFALCQ